MALVFCSPTAIIVVFLSSKPSLLSRVGFPLVAVAVEGAEQLHLVQELGVFCVRVTLFFLSGFSVITSTALPEPLVLMFCWLVNNKGTSSC